ncbi:MAG: glutathione S-transferase family protein [Deltaproteobacteria bacterium]|nr:glutathione S-transferase family protein [Deltaproteobacteria bacterium]
MILHFFPVAPNPTKVRLYIAEKEADGATLGIDESLVNLQSGDQKSPEHLARNPLGKLPALELDDGSCVIESLAIIEFLEELHPEPAMIGRNPRERARVRELERICDLGVLVPIARTVHATRSPLGLPPSPEIAENAREALKRPLQLLDDCLADGRSFVAGSQPTIADCTLAAALQFGRFGEVALDPSLENLHAWDRRFRERPSARAVLAV